MKKLLPYVAVALTSVLVTATSMALYPTNSKEATAAVAAEFDHSNCQYPDRWSNPVDGCDNSDPAVPECIKAAFTQESEKACIDAFVAKYKDDQNPTVPQTTTPDMVTPAPPVTCK